MNYQIECWNQFIIEGDMDALSQIYFHHYDLLFAYGIKHTFGKQVVEDAIQNTFIVTTQVTIFHKFALNKNW